jgi:hypothetical protein
MKRWRTPVLLALGICLTVAEPRPLHAAAKISGQPPCTNIGATSCWGFSGPLSGSYQSNGFFTFRAPSKGTALVSLSGSLVCSSPPTTVPRVVDVLTAIIKAPLSEPVAYSTPSVLRSATVLTPSTQGTAQTFNLGTSRVFAIPQPAATTTPWR